MLSFFYGDNEMNALEYRNKAIEKLQQIQREHARRTCSRSSLMQAQALGYAIEVLKRISTEDDEEDSH